MSTTSPPTIDERVAALPWAQLRDDLDARGFAHTSAVLSPTECEELAGLYDTGTFRSVVNMGRGSLRRG